MSPTLSTTDLSFFVDVLQKRMLLQGLVKFNSIGATQVPWKWHPQGGTKPVITAVPIMSAEKTSPLTSTLPEITGGNLQPKKVHVYKAPDELWVLPSYTSDSAVVW